MKRLVTLLAGAAAGAATAYLFDPVSGRGRRIRLRDRALARTRRTLNDAEGTARHLSNVAAGKATGALSRVVPDPGVDDSTLAQRIQSEVFGSPQIPKDRIALEVREGVAVLRGELDSAEEIADLTRRVQAVAGVREVDSLLHLPGRDAPNKRDALRASGDAAGTTEP